MTRSVAVTLSSILVVAASALAQLTEADPVEAARRSELIGHEVVIDGRVRGSFGFHKGIGFDEFRMEKSSILFRLPPNLVYAKPPKAPVVRVRGVLRKDGATIVCDVGSLEILPADIDRLNAAVKEMPPFQYKDLDAWAAWGERRAAYYGDKALASRAAEIAAEALRAEAAQPEADLLALAERARARNVAEPYPSILAHRAFRDRLATAQSADDVQALVGRIGSVFPQATGPASADPSPFLEAFARDPSATYTRAEPAIRQALDRRLMTDALAKLYQLRSRAGHRQAMAQVAEARAKLGDRPEVVASLQNAALDTAEVSDLRQSEVQEYAKLYEKAGRAEKGRELVRHWLDDQRTRLLSATDADGRVTLAAQYIAMLGDRTTAAGLLREAWKIDPQSAATADAFRRLNYRLVDGDWQAPASSKATASSGAAPVARKGSPVGDAFKGLTRREVFQQLGRPKTIVRSYTQGRLSEQWIYEAGLKRTQFVNFVKRPDMPEALVESHYTID